MEKLKGALFDLDGVLVDTAKYHYLAWKALADELAIPFNQEENERLKGVSRMASLEIILSLANRENAYTDSEKEAFADKKNTLYVQFIEDMDASEILPGVIPLLTGLREKNIKIALGSASKNAPKIMTATGLAHYFDTLIDGNVVSKAKPDPEVFLKGADSLKLAPQDCAVFEDAEAGLQAAKTANAFAIGIGTPTNLPSADITYPNLAEFDIHTYF
ncbi:beta-phosphoglucomutase [Enterococcus crotali]|uniref:beta-phosphoglucomutase n=1 Tax=Enterococcus crotali TaxID=1453587 RepID=UPI00046E5D4D|nr:beta-phosphoglucomutase [Enterococcus crotali]OTP50683.1 beta-phosphoglucomutase [Enterococcus termitis]